MEVFSVLATINLVDMMSSPLNKINKTIGTSKDELKKMDKQINSVLTNAMFPLAIASGAVVTALGSCVGSAIDFESSMADVAKVVNFTSEKELKGMEQTILDMSTKIPMAADGIAAIIANAAQSGVAKENLTEFAEQAAKMGVAFDLTGDQAGKMMADWRSGMKLSLERTYALADSVNHLSNNMNATAPALGEVLQRAGALGMIAGLTEQEVAALGASFLSAGASPEIAATALKKFNITLTKSTAMSKTQAAAFQSLGFEATDLARRMQQDAKGTITEVLTAVSKLPEELQSSMLTQMFGEESIGAIAPLLKNMDTLTNAFDLVSDKTKYAGSMQAEYETRSKTVANAIQLLQNKFKKLSIVIGNYLLPAVSAMISFLSGITGVVTKIIETPVGEFFIQTAGAISLAALALSGYLLSVKYGGFVLTFFAKGLTALKASFLGLSLPIQALIVAVGLLYIAYKTNLGGIADKITAFYNKAKLVFQGVTALLNNFKDGSASISGSLAKQIKDAGLENTVAVIFKVIRRAKAFFIGFYESLREVFLGIYSVIHTVFDFIFDRIGKLLSYFNIFGSGLEEIKNLLPTNDFQEFGKVMGYITSGILALIAAYKTWIIVSTLLSKGLKVLTAATKTFGIVMKFVSAAPLIIGLTALIGLFALFIYHIDTIKETAAKVFNAVCQAVSSAGQTISSFITSAADTIADGAAAIWGYISTFAGNLLNYWKSLANFFVEPFRAAGAIISSVLTGIWDFIVNIFSGKSLYDSGAALIETFKQGILSAWEGLKESFTGVLQSLRNMLPFSDAKEGPLSALTLSGSRLISTLGEGVNQAAPGFIKNVSDIFSQTGAASTIIQSIFTGIWDFIANIFSGKSLYDSGAALIETFKQGILSAWEGLKESFTGVLQSLRNMLPFSDAKEGPLSALTLSGSRLISTLGEGVNQAAPGFIKNVSDIFSQIGAASTIIQSIFTGIWDFIANIFSGKSLYDSGAALIETFKQGILSAWEGLKESFTGVLQSLRNMLPFSDAKEGPLSALPLSGSRLISTLGEGVNQAAPGFIKDVNGIFSQINPSLDTPDIDRMLNSYVNADPTYPAAAEVQRNSAKLKSSNTQAAQTTYTITIQNLNLPNVQSGGDFMKELEKELMAYGA